uniref:Solute carrier family 39 member 3 n=1 Tax=Pongo abelii TaxID=9601 RepID=A0A8I5SXR6_PONAB
MVKLLVAKILCMVGVFFFMLLASLLPVKIIETDFEKAHRSKKILSLCNTFGGGVFLATCFNALLPAVREKCVKTDISPARMEILVISDVSCIPEATASPPFPAVMVSPPSPSDYRPGRLRGACSSLPLITVAFSRHPNLSLPFPCPRAGQADEVPPPEPPASPTAGPGSQSPLENGAWFTAPVRLPHLS